LNKKELNTVISDDSHITIPLRNLVSMIALTGLSVWLYFGLTERLTFLEHQMEMLMIEVEENDNWIDTWQPPESVKESMTKMRDIELQLQLLDQKVTLYTEDVPLVE
tara:strand:+ start:138 stop:458 length:321 start_codon:yes stop_codon:yes gene_type:complete